MASQKHTYSAWAEIDLKAVRANFRALKALTQKQLVEQRIRDRLPAKNIKIPKILGVVKADSYGHGMLAVAKELIKLGVDFFGVSELNEGITLRRNGIKKPILVFETPLPSTAKDIVDYDLIPTVCTYSVASALNVYARSVNKIVDVHLKVDTGMGRLGIWYHEAADFIYKIMRMPQLRVTGLYTHFPLADSNPEFTRRQIEDMYQLVTDLDQQGLVIPFVHGANSIGLTGYKTRIFNLVRPGLMLYGMYPAPGYEQEIRLKPAMSVKARIIFVKEIQKGRGVSYGHTFVAKRNTRVATLSIGYNDGYMRAFSNKADVLINGVRCRVLGRVTMDQLMVDVTDAGAVRVGSEAVIIGRQKNEYISADELAKHADTINYEIVCSLGNRLPRIYKM